MRYWGFGVLGVVLLAASLALVASGLYWLLLVGTCASGGPYVSARPCPDGTGLRVLMLTGGVIGSLVSLVVFSLRGYTGERGAPLGFATWCLGFAALASAFLWAGHGPDAPEGEEGWGLFTGLMAGFFALFVIVPLLFMRAGRGKQEQMEGLVRGGVRADATVLSVEDTGVTVNDNPRVKLTFEIRPPAGASFTGEKTTVVSRVAVPRVGDRATAWYDPRKPEQFAVSFDDPRAIDAGPGAMGVATPPATVTQAAPVTSPGQPRGGDLAEDLTKLNDLRLQGVLTDDEFEKAKERLLGA